MGHLRVVSFRIFAKHVEHILCEHGKKHGTDSSRQMRHSSVVVIIKSITFLYGSHLRKIKFFNIFLSSTYPLHSGSCFFVPLFFPFSGIYQNSMGNFLFGSELSGRGQGGEETQGPLVIDFHPFCMVKKVYLYLFPFREFIGI
jgi:hypothetical protein